MIETHGATASRWSRPRVMWSQLTGSLWFVPGLLVIGAVVLAMLMIEVSAQVDREALVRFPRLFGASAQSSREMLATIAGAMMTVAGVTFSITVLAVAQASSQYTPRILRNFMRDRPNQVTLGTLTGVFVYCIVVMRTIRGVEELLFIPALAVLMAIVLAIVAIGVLVYFIHHIAESLEASHILAVIRADTCLAIDREFPPAVSSSTAPEPVAPIPPTAWQQVAGDRTGYITHVDFPGLLEWRCDEGTILRMERGIGEHVVRGQPLVSVALPTPIGEEDRRVLNALFGVAANRTVDQDPVFGIRQMVDIAVKALSPGVNDTTTAISAIDAIGAVLYRLAGRSDQVACRRGSARSQVVLRPLTFGMVVAVGIDEIRRCAHGNVNVLVRLLNLLALVGAATPRPDRHKILISHADRLQGLAARSVRDMTDREQVEAAYLRTRAALSGAGAVVVANE